ncbi:MAG: nucleoside monophosphate kinase [Candidatus Diapherotrites archaeon]|nr:nucleoside monophosphate kinase [Candidatus Diapherotrites archaeon]
MALFLVFMGPPGAGKSTMAKKLVSDYGLAHFSTGDIIREKLATDPEFKAEFDALVKAGKLLDDERTKQLLLEKMRASNISNGFILDGYPRTVNQAKDLERIMQELGKELNAVIYFSLPERVAIERLTKRLQCPKCGKIYNLASVKPKRANICDDCGTKLVAREDDEAKAIRKRFREYEEKTKPVVDYYRNKGLLYEIDVNDTVEENYKKMKTLVESLKNKQ